MARLPTRRLIQEEIFDARPAYVPFEGSSPYSYRRTRHAGGETFYDLVFMASSQKHSSFGVGVVTGFFPEWSMNGTMQWGRDLPLLAGRNQLADQAYVYDGTEAGARAALQWIGRDLTEIAEPWFEEQTRAKLAHPLVRLGLEWIRQDPRARTAKVGLKYDAAVRDDLSKVLRRRAFELQLDIKIKRDIALLCYELLAYASEVDGRPEP